MTNKERYQRTFRTLHASDRMMEVKEMKRTKHLSAARFVPVAAALVLTLGLATVAYATDFGGIRRAVRLWIQGKQTDAVMEVENGSYKLTFEDEEGNTVQREGGGIAMEPGGVERPLTAEELMEGIDSPEIDFKEDGTVWVYYHNQSINITDRFEKNICYVKLDDNGKDLYLTIKKEANGGFGYSTSSDGYPDPKSLD